MVGVAVLVGALVHMLVVQVAVAQVTILLLITVEQETGLKAHPLPTTPLKVITALAATRVGTETPLEVAVPLAQAPFTTVVGMGEMVVWLGRQQ
jgi:hypothetical protein